MSSFTHILADLNLSFVLVRNMADLLSDDHALISVDEKAVGFHLDVIFQALFVPLQRH